MFGHGLVSMREPFLTARVAEVTNPTRVEEGAINVCIEKIFGLAWNWSATTLFAWREVGFSRVSISKSEMGGEHDQGSSS